MICFKCGTQNPTGSNFCGNCNAILPKVDQTQSEVALGKINERYMQLKEAGDKVLSGQWSPTEFSEFLDRVANAIAEKEAQIKEIEIPPEAADDFREELETGFQGIDLYIGGLAEMRAYVDDEDPAHIEQGLAYVAEGNDFINNARRINRDNRSKLEEMNIDTSTML